MKETLANSTANYFLTWDNVFSSVARIIQDSNNYYIYGPDLFGWEILH
jgi:hypothetical protein